MMFNKRLLAVPACAVLLVAGIATALNTTGTRAVTPPSIFIPNGAIVTSPNAYKGVVDTGVPQVPDAPVLAAAPSNAKLNDDFSSNDLSANYQALDNSTWKVQNGRLQQHGGYDEELGDTPAVIAAKSVTFGDNSLSAQVFPVAMPAGVVFRGSDSGYYRVSLLRNQANNSPKALLEKVQGDSVTTIATASTKAYAGFTANQWLSVSVSAVGSHITVWVNGAQIIDANDSSFSSGWAGVWASSDATTQFDNFRILDASASR